MFQPQMLTPPQGGGYLAPDALALQLSEIARQHSHMSAHYMRLHAMLSPQSQPVPQAQLPQQQQQPYELRESPPVDGDLRGAEASLHLWDVVPPASELRDPSIPSQADPAAAAGAAPTAAARGVAQKGCSGLKQSQGQADQQAEDKAAAASPSHQQQAQVQPTVSAWTADLAAVASAAAHVLSQPTQPAAAAATLWGAAGAAAAAAHPTTSPADADAARAATSDDTDRGAGKSVVHSADEHAADAGLDLLHAVSPPAAACPATRRRPADRPADPAAASGSAPFVPKSPPPPLTRSAAKKPQHQQNGKALRAGAAPGAGSHRATRLGAEASPPVSPPRRQQRRQQAAPASPPHGLPHDNIQVRKRSFAPATPHPGRVAKLFPFCLLSLCEFVLCKTHGQLISFPNRRSCCPTELQRTNSGR